MTVSNSNFEGKQASAYGRSLGGGLLVLFAGMSMSACSIQTDSVFDMGNLWSDDDELARMEGGLLPPPPERQGAELSDARPGAQAAQGNQGSAVGAMNQAVVAAMIYDAPEVPQPRAPGIATGTPVGQQVSALQGQIGRVSANVSARAAELASVHEIVAQSVQGYHVKVATIKAGLQLGTTRANPVLINQWNQAQADLDRLSDSLNAFSTLATLIADDSSSANSILEGAKAAYDLSGAVEEDHRQLTFLEDDAGRTIVFIDRMLTDISASIARHVPNLMNERRNLSTLADAINEGSLLDIPPVASLMLDGSSPNSGIDVAGRVPLVVIHFDRPNVLYEARLGTAVTRAVSQFPTVRFDIVGVSPDVGTPAQVQMAQNDTRESSRAVFKSLLSMGLPPHRISLSEMTESGIGANEVRLYVQ